MDFSMEDASENPVQGQPCTTPEAPGGLRRSPLDGIDPNIPDQRLTASVSKVMKKAAYSPITPFTTPTGKIPSASNRLDLSKLTDQAESGIQPINVAVRDCQSRDSSTDMFFSESLSAARQDMESESPENVPLNALVFKRAFQMVEDFKQSYKMEHEGKLQHMQGYIEDLELSLKALGRECQSSQSTSSASQAPVETVSRGTGMRLFPKIPGIDCGSVSSPVEDPFPVGIDTLCFSRLEGISLTTTTTQTSTVETQTMDVDTCERSSGIIYLPSSSSASQTHPMITCTTDTQTESRETNTHTTDTQTESRETSTHTTDTQTESRGTSTHTTDTQTESRDTSSNTTDTQTESRETSTHTTDTQTESRGTSTHTTDTQTESRDTSSNTTDTQTESRETSTHTTHTQTESRGTSNNTTDTQTESRGTSTHTTDTQTESRETSTHTTDTQTELSETSTHTTDTQTVSKETSTHTTHTQTESRGTNTHTTDTQTESRETSTHTTDTQTQEVTTSDALTMVTPLKHQSQDICVGTSPFVLSLPRPSEVGSSDFSVQQLSSHLESASVSNSLLRSEVESLQSKTASQNDQLARLQRDVSQAEAKVKSETESQVTELLTQQSCLLQQVSELTAKVESLRADKQRLVLQVANVEKDLCLAYKQHKTQIDSLNQEIKDNDYKVLYQRLHQENAELKAQMEEMVHMGNMIKAFSEQQTDNHKQWLEKSLVVCKLAKENKDKEKALEKERADWLTLAEEKERYMEWKLSDYAEVKEERDQLNVQVDHQRELLGSLQRDLDQRQDVHQQNSQLQEQLEAALTSARDNQEFVEQERRALSEELIECQQELAKLKSGKELLLRRLKESREMYQDLECECESTKERAHYLLLNQGQEISDSISAVESLTGRLDQMYRQLDTQVTVWAQQASGSQESVDQSGTPAAMTPCHGDTTPQSTVASIVSAFKELQATTPRMADPVRNLFNITEEGDVEEEVEAEQMASPHVSAFQPVQRLIKEWESGTPLTGHVKTTEEVDDLPLSERTLEQSETPATGCGPANDEGDDLPLSERVEAANQKLRDIFCLMVSLKSHVMSVMTTLQQDMVRHESDWDSERQTLKSQVSSLHVEVTNLSGRIEDSKQRLYKVHQGLSKTTDEKQRLEEEICELREILEARNNALLENSEKESTIKMLSDDNEKYRLMLQQKDNEIKVLQETIEETLGQRSEVTEEVNKTGTGPATFSTQEASLIRENISLKKQVRKLQDELLRCQEEGQAMAQKANHRIKTLTSNWRTAESELNRLDEFVERIRAALKPHTEILISLNSRSILVDLGLLAN